jgi:hypothetical protein
MSGSQLRGRDGNTDSVRYVAASVCLFMNHFAGMEPTPVMRRNMETVIAFSATVVGWAGDIYRTSDSFSERRSAGFDDAYDISKALLHSIVSSLA